MRSSLTLRLSFVAATALALVLMLAAMTGTAAAKKSSADAAGGTRLAVQQHKKLTAGPLCKTRARERASRFAARRLALRAHRSSARRRHAKAVASRSCSKAGAKQSTAGPSSIYWGAWISSQLTGTEAPWDMDAVSKFEQMAGKGLSIVHFGSPFSNCSGGDCSFYRFPTTPMEDVREHGSIPFLSWSSQSIPSSTSEPDYQLSDVIAGTYDSYIRQFADEAAAWGHPFFLRFNWEMNGNWFSWGAGANGNSAADYVAAWRHVHDIFTQEGATNATWVWCPNVDPGDTMTNLRSLYPGASYVDWTGLDGYNWGSSGWSSFDEIYRSTYDEIVEEIAPEKPMFVGEASSSEKGGSKAEWTADMLSKIPTEYPQIRGVLWFEKYDDGMDWPIETSTAATSAFAAGIQNPAYATNTFADLGGSGPIPPPIG